MEGDGAQDLVPFYSQSGSSQFYTIQNTLLGSSWLVGIFLKLKAQHRCLAEGGGPGLGTFLTAVRLVPVFHNSKHLSLVNWNLLKLRAQH